jgi:cytochrome c-type biogenesis protein CcmF
MLFVLIATTFPMISDLLWNEKVTVGPPYYNAWVQPIGLTIFTLMGIGTLFGWKKTSDEALRRAFRFPTVVFLGAVLLQLGVGKSLGVPAIVWADPVYGGAMGKGLRAFNAVTPLVGFSLAAFNAAVIFQEFFFLFRARSRSGANKDTPAVLWYAGIVPGFLHTIFTLPPPSRRRYGGYIVHLGIVMAFIGFTGRAWTVDRETSMAPGQTFHIGSYDLSYAGPRMEVDVNKRMIFADLEVKRNGIGVGALHPAKFIYTKSPEAPVTIVSMLRSLREDLYLVVGNINPETKVASFQIHVNPLVSWIWFGAMVLIFGSVVCMWPQIVPEESRAWAYGRAFAGVSASVSLGLLLAFLPAPAYAQAGMDDMHSGTIRIDNEHERDIFSSLRCMCGCPRDLLSTCNCSAFAEPARQEIRRQIADGMTKEQILHSYQAAHGTESLAVPPNEGALRAIYAVPLVAFFGGAVGLGVTVRRWQLRSAQKHPKAAFETSGAKVPPTGARDEYDRRLDEELRDLDG